MLLINDIVKIFSPISREKNRSDKEIALDIIDCLQKPPVQITLNYILIIERVGSFLELPNPVNSKKLINEFGSKSSWFDKIFSGLTTFNNNVNKPAIIGNDLESQEKIRNELNRGMNDINDFFEDIILFIPRAKNIGFIPPENPITKALSYNIGRIGFTSIKITDDEAAVIVNNIKKYVTLIKAENTGQLNLSKKIINVAQISSANMSLEGFGGTGDTLLDISKLLPDADALIRQKSFEALSIFDFSKRRVKLIFCSAYSPNGNFNGTILGWKKIADASGYVIKRRNIFDGKEETYSLTNDDISKNSYLNEYVNTWIMSFYSTMKVNSVCLFLDKNVPANGYYVYNVQAYQIQNNFSGEIFGVEVENAGISSFQKKQIRDQLNLLDPDINGNTVDTISPYPVLSHFLLGDAKYDWMLAALNIRASINRRDDIVDTRRYSYLNAQLDFLFSQISKGRFVLPKNKNIGQIANNISLTISKFGVSQTIKEILQDTGALYYFEGRNYNREFFSNADTSLDSKSGLISVVAAAIDPETATLDPNILAANMTKLLNSEFVSVEDSMINDENSSATVRSYEQEISSDVSVNPKLNFVNELDKLNNTIVDLATVEGLSIFMRIIRIMSDIGSNRNSLVTNKSTL